MSTAPALALPLEFEPARIRVQPACADTPAPWNTAIVMNLVEVEQLLAQADLDGHTEHELTVLGSDTFVVRWR